MAARVLGDDGCVARWRHEISSRGQQWRCEISYRVELCQPWLAGIVEDEHCTATRRVSDRAQVGEGDGSDSREEGERVERTAVNHLVCLSAGSAQLLERGRAGLFVVETSEFLIIRLAFHLRTVHSRHGH